MTPRAHHSETNKVMVGRVLWGLIIVPTLIESACITNRQTAEGHTKNNHPDVRRTPDHQSNGVTETSNQPKANPMTGNQKCLNDAQKRIDEFKAELEPERLREAYIALANVDLDQERDPVTRARLRLDTFFSWMRLLQILDGFLDPKFDPGDVPAMLVQPPPTKDGVLYAPGADPTLIDDPKARSEYEKAIAENTTKAEHYRMQVHLRRLDERITPRVETFIRDSYASTPSDQQELRMAIEQTITAPARKSAVLRLLVQEKSLP